MTEDYHVNIQFIPPGKQRVEPLCETNWSHNPRSRSVYFVVNAGGILPRVLGFPDFREPEKKDKKEAPPLSPPKSAVPTL